MPQTLAELQALVKPYSLWLVAAAVALVIYRRWPAVLAVKDRVLATWRTGPAVVAPVAPGVVADNTDALDLEAFKRLKARFVRLKCKEGLTALEVCGKEFLTDHSAEVPA